MKEPRVLVSASYLKSPRTKHLLKIWSELQSLPNLPQLDRWLAQRFRENKSFGKKDRFWYSEAVFAAMRFGVFALASESCFQDLRQSRKDTDQMLLEKMAQLHGKELWNALRTLSAERLFLWLSLRRGAEGVDALPDENAIMDAWKDRLASGDQRWKCLWAGLPLYFLPLLERRQQESAWTSDARDNFWNLQGTRAPLGLRLNRPESESKVLGELTARGIEFDHAGSRLSLAPDSPVLQLEAYQLGWIEIQDTASQEIGAAVPLKPGDWVWDCCAGGGGKTLQLASRLGATGKVVASDVRTYKLEEVLSRARKAGFQGISTQNWDGLALPDFPSSLRQRGGFDVVMIDAPCSGSGTWRRSPDHKLRTDAVSIAELTKIQDHLLQTVSSIVRATGYLVYATCSWLVEENELRIAKFLDQHSEFELQQQSLLGAPTSDADTMFVAVLRRRQGTL